MDEKNDFLATLRSELGYAAEEVRTVAECAELFAAPDDMAVLDRIRYRTHVEKQALLEILQERGRALNLGVHVVDSTAAAADAITTIIRRTTPEFSSSRQVIQHDHPDLAALQLWKKLAGEAVQLHTAYAADHEIREKSEMSCIGLTAPRWAVAESATLVELSGAGRPRSTSLLPGVHIALLRLDDILADLGEVYALLRSAPPTEPYVFLTGPSKTADIEANMVYGAHGPREVQLVVVDERKEVHRKGSGLFATD